MLQNLFKPRPTKAQGRALYGAAVEKARDAAFYRRLGVPDRIDARFEMFTLHVALLVERLRGQGEAAGEVAQIAVETYVSSLDDVLREQGIGDLSMSKKMKTLAGLVLGRIKIVGEATRAGDAAAIAGLMSRSIPELTEENAAALGDYALRAHAALAAQPLDEIVEARPAWPAVVA